MASIIPDFEKSRSRVREMVDRNLLPSASDYPPTPVRRSNRRGARHSSSMRGASRSGSQSFSSRRANHTTSPQTPLRGLTGNANSSVRNSGSVMGEVGSGSRQQTPRARCRTSESTVNMSNHETGDSLQTLVEMLVELQKQGTSPDGEQRTRYHCIREETFPNGKTRMTVLFSPTLILDERSRTIGEELSELLLQSYLLSRTRDTRPERQSEYNRGGIGSSTLPLAIDQHEAVLPSASSEWSQERIQALEQTLKQPESTFCLPQWLPFTQSNMCADQHEGECMQISLSSFQQFEPLQTHEILWLYRKFFTSLHLKIRSKFPDVVGKHPKYSELTPPWLRGRAVVSGSVFYLPKPVCVYKLRDLRSKNGLNIIRIKLWKYSTWWKYSTNFFNRKGAWQGARGINF